MKKYRGYGFVTKVDNLEEFQHKFNISNKEMTANHAHGFVEDNKSDIEVIRKILKKKGKYLVRYMDTGDQYSSYFEIYMRKKK